MKQQPKNRSRHPILRLKPLLRFKTRPGPGERRIKIDPRYRNPNYPEFIDRRKNPFQYETPGRQRALPLVYREHPEKRTHLTLGLATGIILLALLTLVLLSLQNPAAKHIDRTKGTVNPVLSF